MNKPVAWMSPDGKVSDTEGKLFYIPLYTHPVKELTDEEIYEVWWQSDVASNYYRDSKEFGIEFARAILRKAQEK